MLRSLERFAKYRHFRVGADGHVYHFVQRREGAAYGHAAIQHLGATSAGIAHRPSTEVILVRYALMEAIREIAELAAGIL